MTFEIGQFTRIEENGLLCSLVSEASTLRIPVGRWPRTIAVRSEQLGASHYSLQRLEDGYARYSSVLPHVPPVIIFND